MNTVREILLMLANVLVGFFRSSVPERIIDILHNFGNSGIDLIRQIIDLYIN